MELQCLKDIRKQTKKTQKEIAAVLHCQREVYRRYETGERDLPVWALIKLADYYGVSTDYLLGRTQQRRPYPKN